MGVRRLVPLIVACILLAVPAGASAHILTEGRAERAAIAHAQRTYPGAAEYGVDDCVRLSRHGLRCLVTLLRPPEQACEVTVRVRYVSHRSSRPRTLSLGTLFCDA
jgi:hypothetical protein